MRRVVVLPAPFEPMKPKRSPRFTERFNALSATIEPYTRVRAKVCTAGTLPVSGGGLDMAELGSQDSGLGPTYWHGQPQQRVPSAADSFEPIHRTVTGRMSRVPRQQNGVAMVKHGAQFEAARTDESARIWTSVQCPGNKGNHRQVRRIQLEQSGGIVAKSVLAALGSRHELAAVLLDHLAQQRSRLLDHKAGDLLGWQVAQSVNSVAHDQAKVLQFAVEMVFHRDLPIPFLRCHGCRERVRTRLQPVTDKQLAGPHRNKNFRLETLVVLEDLGPAPFLSAAPGAHELTAQGCLGL